MDTYFYATTFEADSPEEADEIANGRDLDPPQGPIPTVDELRDRIADELGALADEVRYARTPLAAKVALRRRTERLLDIATQGAVLAQN